jgi:ATP-dependent DNA ligase
MCRLRSKFVSRKFLQRRCHILNRRCTVACLPSRAERPPSGPEWLHEIKHDGFRIMARRDDSGVQLYTRNGYDFAYRFPRIVEAVAKLPVQSCFIDGEAIAIDERGNRHIHSAIRFP